MLNNLGVLLVAEHMTSRVAESRFNGMQVPIEALLEYWSGLPEEHHTALFQLREEDFAAELDAHLKYQLRICRDCRGNVYRAYRELKASKAGVPGTELEICEGHSLGLSDGVVSLHGVGSSGFFERAEEVEDCKVLFIVLQLKDVASYKLKVISL